MMFCGEQPLTVNDAMRRHVRGACVHRPSYHSGAHSVAEVMCDGTVAGHTPPGNKFCYLVNVPDKIMVSLFAEGHLPKN